MSHAIQNGKVVQLSPSMLTSFDASSPFGCQRRGWFKYVKGIKEPQTEKQAGGQQLHAMNEEYLKTGKILLGTPEQTAWFNAGRHYLDTLLTYAVEQPMPEDFRVEGIPVSPMSKCDVVTPTSIIDWKTTSDIEKYGKTPGELARDVQMLIYAKAFHPAAPTVTLAHGQYQTKGRVKFRLSEVEMSRQALDENYERVIVPLVETVKQVATATDVKEVTPNRNACRLCPHQAICPSEKESILMSIFDKLKKSNAPAVPAPSVSLSAPAAHYDAVPLKNSILPPDAPASKPELAAKPVEGFSPVPAPSTVPAPKPTSPETPVAKAEAAPPSVQLTGDSIDENATSEHPPKKRGPGRPPGSKNKPKQTPAEATAAQFEAEVESSARQERAAAALNIQVPSKGDRVDALAEMLDRDIQFESVTVNYGLTLNLGNFSSVRFDVTMGAKGSDPDATYEAVMARVRAKVTEEINKIQVEQREKQTLNPGGK